MTTCKDILEKRLTQNEQLIWYGKPRQGIILRGYDIIAIPFSAALFGFSIYWFHGIVTAAFPPPFSFYLFGVIFLIISSIGLFGRFVIDKNQRRKTCYGITSERILIDYGSPYKTFRTFSAKVAIPDIPAQSFNIIDLPNIELQRNANSQFGTITFGLPPAYSSWGRRGGGASVVIETEFSEIEEAENVYELLSVLKSKLVVKVEQTDSAVFTADP